MSDMQAEVWQHFKSLRPRLREDLHTHAQTFRGEPWVLIQDPSGGQFFRCPQHVMHFLQAFDGRSAIEEVLRQLPEEERPAQEDVLRIFTLLDEKMLLAQPLSRDALGTLQAHREQGARARLRRWMMPLAIKWALWDPDSFLTRTQPVWARLMHPLVGWCCVLLALFCGTMALELSDALSAHWQSRFLDAGSVLSLWLLYPCVKLLHELGHAMAIKRWGGEVHELGVMWLVFLPVPYVDATASYAFPSKYPRMLVAAAGIVVELMLASIALLVWWQADEGLIRDLAFNIMVLAGISTLLINGNPLLKFDGYHVLSEYLEIPNLAARSQQAVRAWWGNALLGHYVYPINEQGTEGRIIMFYGVAAACYRIIIAVGIAWWIAGKAFVLGVALALWYVAWQWCWPALKGIAAMWTTAQALAMSRHLLARMGLLLVLVLMLMCWPWQRSIVFDAVLSLPEDAQIRSESAGFVVAQHVAHGAWVNEGQKVFTLHNAELVARIAAVEARLAEHRQRVQAVPFSEEVQRQILRAEGETIAAELAELYQQRDALNGRSPVSGKFESIFTQPAEGRHVMQGEVLAYVFRPEGVTLSAVVEQAVLPRLQQEGVHYEVLFPAAPARSYAAQLVQEYPAFSRRLPGALLGSGAGGDVRIDARDESGTTAAEAVYQLRFVVPDYALDFLADRARVKATHPPQSLLTIMTDGLRRLWWQHQSRLQ